MQPVKQYVSIPVNTILVDPQQLTLVICTRLLISFSLLAISSYQLIEMKKEDPVADSILGKLRAVSPDDLSPREAWQMLADLAAEAGRKES